MTQPSRSFARIATELPVRVRVVDEAEAAAIAHRLMVEPSYSERPRLDAARRGGAGENAWERAALAALLRRIESMEIALGRIAEALGVDLSERGAWIEGETVNVSGSGFAARFPQIVPEESLIDLELTLLGDPTATIRALGRIVSVQRPDGATLPVGRFQAGVGFHVIHDEDREAVVRHTFRVQRAALRERQSDEGTGEVFPEPWDGDRA